MLIFSEERFLLCWRVRDFLHPFNLSINNPLKPL